MEEIVPMIFHGCKLARDLESNMPNLANQPNILSGSCDEIMRVFSTARDRINARLISPGDQEENIGGALAMQQWLRYNLPRQPVDPRLHPQLPGQQEAVGVESVNLERWRSSGSEAVQSMEEADLAARGSYSQRARRRNDDDRRIVRVPAPRMGNIEIPPEDGYTWRKYGQKEILGSRFPRAYYRCTHQKLYQCPAKKQVQRLDHDASTFKVIYRGNHTCSMSSTAPSVPSANIVIPRDMAQQPATTTGQPTSVPVSHWLSMDIRPPTWEGGSGGAGPSTVVEFADVMFNSSGSSSSNMDLIFSAPMEDKWDTGNKQS